MDTRKNVNECDRQAKNKKSQNNLMQLMKRKNGGCAVLPLLAQLQATGKCYLLLGVLLQGISAVPLVFLPDLSSLLMDAMSHLSVINYILQWL